LPFCIEVRYVYRVAYNHHSRSVSLGMT
jgi:hypothetical protein